MYKLKPSCELEGELFKNVFDKTPDYIKNLDLMNFDNENGFTFTLKKLNAIWLVCFANFS